ncbi:MAG: hypothetical protein Ct9H90mP27_6790 [Gammaproteobacteria bacterium]|nr:MAG: hypothetical protein Ct9H90mP27_6790 [Gammaproteobacteria bacterium]
MIFTMGPPKTAEIICVDPKGPNRVVAEDVFFPNGMVITPDGKTLIAAETFGRCLTAFDIEQRGKPFFQKEPGRGS